MNSRYPGTQPFTDSPEDVLRFFGRDAEAEELYLRVLSVPLLVQFGNSGLGKTSLLQAGLFPRLRRKPFLPAMIRLNNAGESLTDAVLRAIRESCASEGIEPACRSTERLWDLLSSLTVWRDDLLLTPVLVFDQFEEVFTLRDAAFRAEIASELGALASGIPPAGAASTRRPVVKVLISLREDYLGALEEFSAAIPSLFQERLRLAPLTEEAARDAVTGPARLDAPGLPPPFEFDPAALDMIMNELKGKSGVIEPFQLQLLARHAESIAARKGGGRLTPEDFRGAQDFESVLKNFYRNTLQRIGARPQRTKAQVLVEEGLLGGAGHRLMLEERQIGSDYGVTPETLQTLESSRLVRRERRMESVFYEISHDRIADSIFRGRSSRIPRKVRRWLWVAAVVGVWVVVGLTIANYRVSRERDAAERWISLLLGEEFFGALRDSGRSTASKRLQDQILAESQAGFGTPVTRGLALRNDGDLERLDGTLPEALTSFQAALAELERAPRDASTLRELARTHDRIGDTLEKQGHLTRALQHYDTSIGAWREAVAGNSPLVNDDCMGLAESLTSAARLHGRMGQSEAALRHCDEAFDISFGASFDTADRCGRRPGPVQPDPDVRGIGILTRIALVHHDLVPDLRAVEGATVLAELARELSPPSIKATTLATQTMAVRGFSTEGLDATLRDYLEILEQLRAMQLWDVDNRSWQQDRAAVRVMIAATLATCIRDPQGCRPGLLDDAEVTVADAEATLRTASSRDPSNVELHDALAGALHVHGFVLAARGPAFRTESMARFDEAERLLTTRRREPNDPRGAEGLSLLLTNKAVSLLALGDPREASATLQRSIAVLERAIAAYPKRPSLMALLRQTRGVLSWATSANAPPPPPEGPDRTGRDRLRQQGVQHRLAAETLLDTDPAAALRELNASEAALRAGTRRHPTYHEGYFELVETYVRMNDAFEKLGHPDEQLYALGGATTAAQLARWLGPPELRHQANDALLLTRYLLSAGLIRQKRFPEAVEVLEDVVSLGQEFLADPAPDGGALGIIGDAKCRIAGVQRDIGQTGWHQTLEAGLIFLRKAAALDPGQEEKLRAWSAYASEGAPAPTFSRPIGSRHR